MNKNASYQEFFPLFLSGLVIESACFDDLVVNVELEACMSIHHFFDALLCDKMQNADGFRLTYTMGTILGLEISMRIPITIKAVEEECIQVSSLVSQQTIKN
jgi:hypothetical protein